jgi:hypothetical protein
MYDEEANERFTFLRSERHTLNSIFLHARCAKEEIAKRDMEKITPPRPLMLEAGRRADVRREPGSIRLSATPNQIPSSELRQRYAAKFIFYRQPVTFGNLW